MSFGGILGFDNGIVLAPMGADIAGPKLVAAVAEAGGIGLLASPVNSYDMTVKAITATKKLTKKPFGAGILLEFDNTNTVKAIFDEKLACMQVYWGDFNKEMVDEAHAKGVKILHQVGSLADAEKAVAAGVDCIIAQGVEAGGHVIGHVALSAFVPRVVDLVGDRNIAVVAAGSIGDARGYVAALSWGAHGICMGTRFVATKESYANDYYKQQLLHYTEADTDLTDLYSRATWRAPTRCLNTPFHNQWKGAPDDVENDDSQPIIGYSIIHGGETVLRRFAGQVANQTTAGELEHMVMYAGQGVGLVKDIIPAGDVINNMIEGAKKIIQDLGTKYLPVPVKDEVKVETVLPQSDDQVKKHTTAEEQENKVNNVGQTVGKINNFPPGLSSGNIIRETVLPQSDDQLTKQTTTATETQDNKVNNVGQEVGQINNFLPGLPSGNIIRETVLPQSDDQVTKQTTTATGKQENKVNNVGQGVGQINNFLPGLPSGNIIRETVLPQSDDEVTKHTTTATEKQENKVNNVGQRVGQIKKFLPDLSSSNIIRETVLLQSDYQVTKQTTTTTTATEKQENNVNNVGQGVIGQGVGKINSFLPGLPSGNIIRETILPQSDDQVTKQTTTATRKQENKINNVGQRVGQINNFLPGLPSGNIVHEVFVGAEKIIEGFGSNFLPQPPK